MKTHKELVTKFDHMINQKVFHHKICALGTAALHNELGHIHLWLSCG